ncbi:MAG: TPM domain-containing protein [Cyclobacteriaceae bacterium]|nr:TPM domain-containing protein [Cyclobacteriaceae bacterium]
MRFFNIDMRFHFLLVAVLFSITTFAQKAVPELWNMRVHDEAHVLTQKTIDQLEKQLAHYEDSTSNQIAILIISTLDGDVLEEYSLRVAEAWRLGQKNKDNGVLLLIAVDDHKMRIEVGEGLEGVLTDALCNRIIRNEMAPAFRRADFDGGVTAAVNGITAAIGGEYSATDINEISDLSMTARIAIGFGLYVFLGLFAFFALLIKGGWGWGMYAFLIPFYSLFPLIVIPWDIWYVPGLAYIILFPILKILVGRSKWGQRVSKKMTSSGGGRSYSSGSRSSWGSGSSGGSSFSGGGGSFGGGGSSGGW